MSPEPNSLMPQLSQMETFGVLSERDLALFDLTYKDVVDSTLARLQKDIEASHLLTDSIVKMLDYNVTNGKRIRALLGMAAYKYLVKEPSDEEFKLVCIAAWVNEIVTENIQGAGLVSDDILDRSETRRGQLCWYKVPGVGLNAVNHAFVMEQIAYLILEMYFEDKPFYCRMISKLKEVALRTVIGQIMDLQTGGELVDTFTTERYSAIVKNKTSYYTVCSPIVGALVMVGRGDEKELINLVEEIALEFGHYFQVQDDFLDCFGDVGITGKVGTDIQDNKCTWLVVKAVEMCDAKQLEILKTNYGKNDTNCVKTVKDLYNELDLVGVYTAYEDETYDRLTHKIKGLPADATQVIFLALLGYLYKRRR